MKDIKLFLTDVDGCMTDGGMYYTEKGDEFKRFCVYDGMGIVLLRKAGIPCGILTSENTNIGLQRGEKLGLEYIYTGVGRVVDGVKMTKLDAANKIWTRISYYTCARDVEFNNGKNAQETLGSIYGISDSITSTSSNV